MHLLTCDQPLRLHWRTQGTRHGDGAIPQHLGCDCEKTCPNQIQVLEEEERSRGLVCSCRNQEEMLGSDGEFV